MNKLEKSWFILSNSYGAADSVQSICWQELVDLYSGPGRYYHTLGHIQTLLKLLEEHLSLVHSPDIVAWAIWYHDAIYDPISTNNEAQSALLAQQRLQQLVVPTPMIADVMRCIEATKHTSQANAIPADVDFLLDIDLGILGSSPAQYKHYTQAIRKEYHMFTDDRYNAGRRLVLEHFLAMPRIYRLDCFRDKWEAQARLNLSTEYEQL